MGKKQMKNFEFNSHQTIKTLQKKKIPRKKNGKKFIVKNVNLK